MTDAETNLTDLNALVAWRVSGVPNEQKIQGPKIRPLVEDFKTREEADAYKKHWQADGLIVCVSPVYAGTRAVREAVKYLQSAPFGKFRTGWRLHK